MKSKGFKRILAAVCALAIVAVLPAIASADTTQNPPVDQNGQPMRQPSDQGGGQFFVNSGSGGNGGGQVYVNNGGGGRVGARLSGIASFINENNLTDDQRTAYESALQTYYAAEDAALADLVNAGLLTQDEVDAYAAQRPAEKVLSQIDRSQWTQDQMMAYFTAMNQTGADMQAAVAALVQGGQLTQDQGNALLATDVQNPWQKLLTNNADDPTLQTAIATMTQAQQDLMDALTQANIQVTLGFGGGSGNGAGGSNGSGPRVFTRGNGQNGNGNQGATAAQGAQTDGNASTDVSGN